MTQKYVNSLLTTHLDLLELDPSGGIATGTIRLWWFALCVAAIGYIIMRCELKLPAKLLWLYLVARVLWIIEFPIIHYGYETLAFQADAGQNLAEVLLLPLLFGVMGGNVADKLWRALPWVMVAQLACVWLKWKGLLISPSFNLALVALFLPLAPNWLWFLALPTILSQHAATAQVIVAVHCVVLGWRMLPRKLFVPLCVAAAAGGFFFVWLHSHNEFFDMDGRFARWSLDGKYMRAWLYADHTGKTEVLHWGRLLLGMGPSSFMRISLAIDNYKHPSVLFLHNEFLQIPWEAGLVALALALWVYAVAVRQEWKNARAISVLVALIPMCITWHPFRMAGSAFMVAMLLDRALHWPMTYIHHSGPADWWRSIRYRKYGQPLRQRRSWTAFFSCFDRE